MTIGILQQEKIISQIADARQIGNDYYDDKSRMDKLKKITFVEINSFNILSNLMSLPGIFISFTLLSFLLLYSFFAG